jgi:ABC-2 type transport system ATP-binding protein
VNARRTSEAGDGDVVISVSRLRKVYGEQVAVADAGFTVRRGEIFGLLGPNGAGKTTTVECLQGLRQADSGELQVLGLNPGRQARELRRRIGAQLQESALPDHIRVWEALQLFASITPGGHDWRDIMAQWGLADKRKDSFRDLSGGQRQRLFVALALVNGPELVFLDEMTTGLDPHARRIAWDLIREVRASGTTVVLVTHFMEEAERLCDRIAIMNAGSIVAVDSPRDLVAAAAGERKVVFSSAADMQWLRDVPFVDDVRLLGPRWEVRGRDAVLAHVAAALMQRGYAPADLRLEAPTLEDVYLDLTGNGDRQD